jgi:DNA-binding NtrC family response regulator
VSSSSPPNDSGTFRVRSDSAVVITVHDAARVVCAQAEGELVCTLPPGLYRLQLERAGAIDTQVVDHETTTCVDAPGPPLRSPVPFRGAESTMDSVARAAHAHSINDTAPPLGEGQPTGRLFVFVRRGGSGSTRHALPSEPLAILDAVGRLLRTISADTAWFDNGGNYVAYSSRAVPGTYRLRGVRSRRDVSIVIPAGRSAQVFIMDTGVVRLDQLRIGLTRIAAFDPESKIWSAMESVLAVLQTRSSALPISVRNMLPAAIEDDLCFGIAAAHVLWRAGEREKLTEVMRYLAHHGEIADVAILAHLRGAKQAVEIANTPPLLCASLTMAFSRPAFSTHEMGSFCALAQAARTQLHDSIWCTWSARVWDERWIAPAVEQVRAQNHNDKPVAIACALALPLSVVEHALQLLDASIPSAPTNNGHVSHRAASGPPGYRLGDLVGRGSRSSVYRAIRSNDECMVAIKLVPALGGMAECARIHRQLDQRIRVDHPMLLAPRARGTLSEGVGVWLEMELYPGSVLDRLSQLEAPMELADAQRMLQQTLTILANLHDHDIAHGNIHPGNLLLREDDHVVLAGHELGSRRPSSTASSAESIASWFVAPELVGNDEPPQPASDVWSAAATFYFMVTLELPFEQYAGQTAATAVTENPAISLSSRRPDIPRRLAACIDRALSFIQGERPRDAAAFRDEIEQRSPGIRRLPPRRRAHRERFRVRPAGGEPGLAALERERDFYRALVEFANHDSVDMLLDVALDVLVMRVDARHASIEVIDGDRGAPRVVSCGFEGDGVREMSRAIIDNALATESVQADRSEAMLCVPIVHSTYRAAVYVQGRARTHELGLYDAAIRRDVELLAGALSGSLDRLLSHPRDIAAVPPPSLLHDTHGEDPFTALRGKSHAMGEVIDRLRLAAPVDVHVLLTGPPGAGKTRLANALHLASHRRNGPFVTINCATTPEAHLEHELFGDGASRDSRSRGTKVEAAERGTLLLYEISELAPGAQSRLLQLLQSDASDRVGGRAVRRANVRVVATTSTDVRTAIAEGTFDEELYYRLQAFEIQVPPLSERSEDLIQLSFEFVRQVVVRCQLATKSLSPRAIRAIQVAQWPGNARQLEDRVEAAALRAHTRGSDVIEDHDLFGNDPASTDVALTLQNATQRFQRDHVAGVLTTTAWDVHDAAKILDVSRSQIYRLIRLFDLKRA